MSKISELSDGGALQSTDYLIAVRSGGNVKVRPNGAVSGTTGQFSTSLNVDGTVTADGLTVDGTFAFTSAVNGIINNPASCFINIDSDNNNAGEAFYISRDADNTTGARVAKFDATGDISFYEDTGTTPKFFWDASREALGIGTSTPDEALRVNGSSNGDSRLRLQNQGTDIGVFGSYLGWVGSGNANDLFVSSVGANNLILGSSSIERMRIDSSGNVGIGTSSPGGGANDRQLTVAGSTSGQATFSAGGAVSNSVGSTTSLGYVGTVTNHPFIFTTNNTERARIDSSGNLLVGGTTAESKVNIYTGGSAFSSGTMPAGMTIYSTTIDGQGSMLSFKANPGAQGIAGIAGVRSSGWETELRFYTNNTAGQDSFSERARIDASGRLLVGLTTNATAGPVQAVVTGTGTSFQTNPAVFGAVAGAAGREVPMIYGSDGTNSALISMLSGTMGFFTNGTEHARIDSSGNLLVGKTATTAAGALISGGQIQGTVTGAASATFQAWNQATSGDNLFVDFYTEGGSGTQRGSIDYNRTVGLVRYNTTSDYRAKDIIGPVQNTGATIDALKVYEGKMKGATQSRPMLIAHEAQEQAPYAVSGTKDAVNEDGTPDYQQIDHSSLVPLLIAEIQSLRARVAQLEGA